MPPMPLRFGITSGIPDLPGKTHAELYRDTITMVEAAEDLGFDTCWFTEHHFSRHDINSAILTTLAALAMRTHRIRLGSAVCVLPFWNPVRLAEEVAVVDLVSGGRFELGVGSGYRLHEFAGLGMRVEDRTGLFRESLDVLAGLWTGEPFRHHGRHYQIASRGLRPQPLQRPHPPLWMAAQAADGILWAAEHGAGWMFVLPPGETIEGWQPARDLYLEKVEAAGGTPRIYLHVPTYVARRPVAQVRSDAEPWVRWWLEAVGEGETIWNRGGPGVLQSAVDHMFQYGYFGGPEEILRQIDRYAEFGVTDFTFHVAFGPPHDRVLESMEALARWVLPEARRLVRSADRRHLASPS